MANIPPYSNENYPVSPTPFWPGSFVSTRCGHMFFKLQIEEWMREGNRSDCPMCEGEIGELTPVMIATDNVATNRLQNNSSSNYSSKPRARAREEQENYYQDESDKDPILESVLKKSKIETHCPDPDLEEAINASLPASEESLSSTYSPSSLSSLATSPSSCRSSSPTHSSSSSWSSSSYSQSLSYNQFSSRRLNPLNSMTSSCSLTSSSSAPSAPPYNQFSSRRLNPLNSMTSSCSSTSSSSAPSAPPLRTTTSSDWSVGPLANADEFFVKIQSAITQFNTDLGTCGIYPDLSYVSMIVKNSRDAIAVFNRELGLHGNSLTSRSYPSSVQDDNLSARKENISRVTKKFCDSLNGLRTNLLQNKDSINQYEYANLDKALASLSITSEDAIRDWNFQTVIPPRPSSNDVPRRTSCSLVQVFKSIFGFSAS